jgi:hypothetical protein
MGKQKPKELKLSTIKEHVRAVVKEFLLFKGKKEGEDYELYYQAEGFGLVIYHRFEITYNNDIVSFLTGGLKARGIVIPIIFIPQ